MQCKIDDLPDEILEYILSLIPPYRDLEGCMYVSKRWYHATRNVMDQSKSRFIKSVAYGSLFWNSCPVFSNRIGKRHSHSACIYGNSMYVFGGCTAASTTFNDLWRLDLDTRTWVRPFITGNYPSPKACATMLYYDKRFILFGGWSQCSNSFTYEQRRLFNELHVYKIKSSRWIAINALETPPPITAHSATIHKNLMVVFGGVIDSDRMVTSNDIWCLNLDSYVWTKKTISSVKPQPRYGQSQIAIDDTHLLVIGGCSGRYSTMHDAWLLTMEDPVWTWKKVNINSDCGPASGIWYHQACKVGNNIVVLSKKKRQFQLNKRHTAVRELTNAALTIPIPETLNIRIRPYRLPNTHRKKSENTLTVCVLDISNVLCDECSASWIPLKESCRPGPDERILYSLVLGRGELIMFGGFKKEQTRIQGQTDFDDSQAYNDLYFISPPKYVI